VVGGQVGEDKSADEHLKCPGILEAPITSSSCLSLFFGSQGAGEDKIMDWHFYTLGSKHCMLMLVLAGSSGYFYHTLVRVSCRKQRGRSELDRLIPVLRKPAAAGDL
jgi:hypothetical protein